MRIAAVTTFEDALTLAREQARVHGTSRVYVTDGRCTLYFVDRLPDLVWGGLTRVFDVDSRGHTHDLPGFPESVRGGP